MTEEICHLCGGNLKEGFTELRIRFDNELLVIKDIPAEVCSCCDEALITPETSRKIDRVIADYRAGKLLAKPLVANEIALGQVA